jgi:anti-sigma B factor antagonist
MTQALTIRVRHQPGHILITVAGEIDIATAGRLRERVAELAASGLPLIVGLDQVTFIDATGLGVLVGAARRATAHGGSLRVVCARPQTRKLFRLTGLDRHLRLSATWAEALATLPPGKTKPAPRQGSGTAPDGPSPPPGPHPPATAPTGKGDDSP